MTRSRPSRSSFPWPSRPPPAATGTIRRSSSPRVTSRPPTCGSRRRSEGGSCLSRSGEGDRVAAGQELARIDATDIALALDGAKADRGQADAELRLRVAGSRKEDVAGAEAQVSLGRADLDGAQRDLDRLQGLLDAGSGTTKSRDDALTRRDVAGGAGSTPPARRSSSFGRARARRRSTPRARVSPRPTRASPSSSSR